MADSPVLFDDGGSTRIKHFRLPPSTAVGAMDGLLDVKPNGANIGVSDHEFPLARGPFTTLKVGFVDPVAGGTTESVAAPALVNGDRIELVSGALTIRMDIGGVSATPGPGGAFPPIAGTLRIIGAAGIDPQVDAKQSRRKRRYVVTNAPPIDRVTVIRAAGATVMFNSSLNNSVYTFVHLT